MPPGIGAAGKQTWEKHWFARYESISQSAAGFLFPYLGCYGVRREYAPGRIPRFTNSLYHSTGAVRTCPLEQLVSAQTLLRQLTLAGQAMRGYQLKVREGRGGQLIAETSPSCLPRQSNVSQVNGAQWASTMVTKFSPSHPLGRVGLHHCFGSHSLMAAELEW